MSNKIDWSKAPEGATHRGAINWFKSDGEKVYTFDGAVWHPVSWEIWQLAPFAKRPSIHADEWSGEGLPPVGVVCEYRICDGPWYKCEIRYTFKRPDGGVIAYCQHLDHEQALYASYCCFRPIRTPEQIAADERESAVNGMLCYDALGGSRRGLAEALYDAGYRKP